MLAATPNLRLAVITDLQGVLEPCGCTRDSLGGLDRMAHALDELRRDPSPLLVVVAGETWAEEATATDNHRDQPAAAQASLKAQALNALLEQLGIDVLAPGARDLARADGVLTELARAGRIALLGASAREEFESMRPRLDLDRTKQQVTVVSDLKLLAAARAGDHAQARQLVIALAEGPPRAESAALPVDVRVRSGLLAQHSSANVMAGVLELTGARQGRELLVAELWAGGAAGAAWREIRRRPVGNPRENLARIIRIPLDGSVASEPATRRTLDQLFARIRALNDSHDVDSAPAPVASSAPAYVGSRTCAACHTEAYVWWLRTPHARAFQTLEQRGREYDLDCITCHVTGFARPGGARLGALGELRAVGCESCHGPGGAHVDNPRPPHGALARAAPERICTACHDAQHSDRFDFATQVARLRAPGHADARAMRLRQSAGERDAP